MDMISKRGHSSGAFWTGSDVIVIVNYGLGNLRSIYNMLYRAGIESVISSEPDELRAASQLILPGVGHFRFAMESLHRLGLVDVLNERVLDARVPILGICLGAQHSEKVPHMGWTTTSYTECVLFQGMSKTPRFYYVHSYHFRCDDPGMVICTAEHGYRFASGVAFGNILGVQFHPEKSHVYGQQLLKNFVSMNLAG